MRRLPIFVALILAVPSLVLAQDVVPFKLGTFEDGGNRYLGLVLDDTLVVDIGQANQALGGAQPAIPSDMTDLIVQYDELAPRLRAIAAAAASDSEAAYVKHVSAVKVLPPMRPHIIYNAASNYSLHAAEMARRSGEEVEEGPVPDPIPGIWERTQDDRRQNPYIFLKMASTVIADGEAIRIPPSDLIVQYDELAPRLRAIAAAAASDSEAAYVKHVSAVKVLPPMRPHIIYNAASNYSLHAAEMARRSGEEVEEGPVPDPIPGIWERTQDDRRQNPYIFLKMASTVIADGEAIRIPPQRTNLDWECELAVVIAKPASRISVAER